MTEPTSAAVTLELIRKAQAGDIAARNRVVLDNMRLVTKRAAVAARRCGKSAHLQDIINTAVVGASDSDGLIHAIAKFDCSRGLRFSTYAVRWIDNAIQNALTQIAVVRLGRNSHGEARLRSVVAEITCEDTIPPTPREVRARCVFRGNAAPSDRAITRALVSVRAEELPGDSAPPGERRSSAVDIRAITSEPDPVGVLETREDWRIVHELLEQLTPREQAVMRHAYGLDGATTLERAEIATTLGISAVRVGHLQTSALRQLQRLAAVHGKSRPNPRQVPRSAAA